MSEDEENEYAEEEELEEEQPKQKKHRTPLDESIDELLGEEGTEFWTN